MSPFKGKGLRVLGLLLPPVFLTAYLLGPPLPVPAFLTPVRTYLLAPAAGAPPPLAGVRLPRGSLYAVLADRVVPMTPGSGPAAAEILALSLPARPSVETALLDAERSPRRFGRIRLVCGTVPSAEEMRAVRDFRKRTGRAVSLLVPPDDDPLLRAISYAHSAGETAVAATLAPGPGASRYDILSASQGSLDLGSWTATDLPASGIRLSASGSGVPISLAFWGPGGSRNLEILIAEPDQGAPRVLLVSRRTEKSGFIEALYPTLRVDPESLDGTDLAAYPLIVFDGVPLRDIPRGAARILAELVERKAVSLLFAADSPDFGRAGDNPDLEPLLPVELLPRSLKRLPDLAVLLLLDVSGSMFGDKLSLAKAAGVEFLKALKPTDRVGFLLFAEDNQWLYRFEENSTLQPNRDIPNLAAGGGTDLAAALREGLALLERQGDRDRHAVVVSDGVTKPADFRALEDRAKRAGISLSTIAVGKDADFALMERLARNTGGRAYRAEKFDEIPALLFEDRTSVSRTAFSRETQAVLALNGERVSTVDGMALLTARDPSTVLFSNELGDPLLVSREYRNRAVVVFASDLYGGYTDDFFRSPRAVSQVKRRLDSLLAEERVAASVMEHSGGVEIILRSPWLVSPSARVLGPDQRTAWEGPFRRAAPGTFSAALPLSVRGTYTAVLSDRGAAFSRIPIAVNGLFRGIPVSAYEEARRFRPALFVLYRDPEAWLVAAFLASLAVTVLLRLAPGGKRARRSTSGSDPGGGFP